MAADYKHIAIEGPIGVGKSSLARRLAETFDAELLLEAADKNPFLENFYREPRYGALPAQLFFLFQRAQQMRELRQADMFTPMVVADFMFAKDRLFAELTLSADELNLYQQVLDSLAVDVPEPDLVVYLQAPVEVLQARIAQRGIRYEQTMGGEYLQRLAESYTRFFHAYNSSPLLIVNAGQIDWVHNDQDYELLVEKINSIKHGRHFFNPGATEF